MFYNYPKEFIVPVSYALDLKDKILYRGKESETLQLGKLLMLDGNMLQEPAIMDEDIVEGDLEYENMKKILNYIDEDYANSETLNMKV